MALRQQVLVDNSVQGVLVGRVILYWLCGVLYISIGTFCFQLNENPEASLAEQVSDWFHQIWPWLPTAVLVLPLAVYDVIRLSNLFAGPIFRLRRHFKMLREDIAAEPLKFRNDDYWADIAEAVNDMQAEILRLKTGVVELQDRLRNANAIPVNLPADSQQGMDGFTDPNPLIGQEPSEVLEPSFSPSGIPAFTDEEVGPIAAKLATDVPVPN